MRSDQIVERVQPEPIPGGRTLRTLPGVPPGSLPGDRTEKADEDGYYLDSSVFLVVWEDGSEELVETVDESALHRELTQLQQERGGFIQGVRRCESKRG